MRASTSELRPARSAQRPAPSALRAARSAHLRPLDTRVRFTRALGALGTVCDARVLVLARVLTRVLTRVLARARGACAGAQPPLYLRRRRGRRVRHDPALG
eukprot:265309-Pleurochrysis_carterae.AAC.1